MKKVLIIVTSLVVTTASIGIFFYVRSLPAPTLYFEPAKSMTSNMSDSKQFLKFTPVLVLNERGHDKFLTENASKVCNIILFSIRSKTEDELRDPNINQTLSREIVAKLQQDLNIEYVVDVTFSEFVIG